jgi:DNA ligase 1
MTYNPDYWDGKGKLPTLYSRTATGAVNEWVCWTEGKSVVVEWGQHGGTLQTAKFACEPKNEGRSNATTAKEQARLEAISKWKMQVRKKYFESMEEAAKGPKLRPMLAKDFPKVLLVDGSLLPIKKRPKKTVQYPVSVQRKYDGVRCLAYWDGTKVMLHSRGGKIYDVEHIRAVVGKILEPGEMLDGELYVHGLSCQKITSLVKRPQKQSLQLTFCVYDKVNLLAEHPEIWEVRKEKLANWFYWATKRADLDPRIVEVETCTADCEQEVKRLHDLFVTEGYEGAIVRLPFGEYRVGYRSPNLLKYKAFDDAEFKLTGFRKGKGKCKDVPIFECTMKNGRTFDVTPRGTDAVRAELLRTASSLMGQKYTVRYFGFTDEGIPRFPVGIGVREKGI